MDEIKNLLKKLMLFLGLDEASSTIYSTLAVSEKPLTIKEIIDKTNYSIARVYASLGKLIKEDLVEKIRQNGSIKFIANINFINVFENRRKEIMDNFLKPLIDYSGREENESIKEIIEHARKIYDYFKIVNEKSENVKKGR
ncbi:MAG: helix-turn-helix domain-containing protein [Thermoplasmata archaeon]|nr:helix-turn-helix domain-containing protein [Thermoplasmata archaeon]